MHLNCKCNTCVCMHACAHTASSKRLNNSNWISGWWSVVPNLFGTRDQFHGRQFIHKPGLEKMVLEWFKCITFIVHVTSYLMPPLIWQKVRVWGPDVGGPRIMQTFFFLNSPKTISPNPGPLKNCLPWNISLVLKKLGTADHERFKLLLLLSTIPVYPVFTSDIVL